MSTGESSSSTPLSNSSSSSPSAKPGADQSIKSNMSTGESSSTSLPNTAPVTAPTGACPRPPTHIGNSSPSPDCQESSRSATGESFLFCNDSDQMLSTDQAAFLSLIPLLQGMDRIDVHGYASPEGPKGREAPYNLNLSCMRANRAAVVLIDNGIDPSKVHTFKHGGTPEFGAANQNRRVIIQGITLPCSSTPPTCPIGGLAPLLRDPHLPSGALCRGACGPDCPSSCAAQPNVTLCIPDSTGHCHVSCTYSSVIECGSHAGCREHDACYDRCAAILGETSLCPIGILSLWM